MRLAGERSRRRASEAARGRDHTRPRHRGHSVDCDLDGSLASSVATSGARSLGISFARSAGRSSGRSVGGSRARKQRLGKTSARNGHAIPSGPIVTSNWTDFPSNPWSWAAIRGPTAGSILTRHGFNRTESVTLVQGAASCHRRQGSSATLLTFCDSGFHGTTSTLPTTEIERRITLSASPWLSRGSAIAEHADAPAASTCL